MQPAVQLIECCAVRIPHELLLCFIIRHPRVFAMLGGELYLLGAFKTKSVFGNYICILAPMHAAFWRYDQSWNIRQAFQFNPFLGTNSTLFKAFSLCSLQWGFVILSAAGNELPLARVCSLKDAVANGTIDCQVWYCQYLKRCSHSSQDKLETREKST